MVDSPQPGDILPAGRLRLLTGGPPLRLGPNRPRAQVLVLTHAAPCEGCLGYLRSFEVVAAAVRAEKADVLALVGGAWVGEAGALPVPAGVAEGPLVAALPAAGTPAVVVADRFGQVFARTDAGDDHAFPDHAEVLGRLLGIGIGCPECGVPDIPCGDLLPEAGARSGGMAMWM